MRQWCECNRLGMMRSMLSMRDLETQDLQGLTPEAITALAAQMLQHIQHQAGELQSKGRELDRAARHCPSICAASSKAS